MRVEYKRGEIIAAETCFSNQGIKDRNDKFLNTLITFITQKVLRTITGVSVRKLNGIIKTQKHYISYYEQMDDNRCIYKHIVQVYDNITVNEEDYLKRITSLETWKQENLKHPHLLCSDLDFMYLRSSQVSTYFLIQLLS